MTLFSRETTVSKSFWATVCAPMMAITDSNSTRICLNHSSYTEGWGGMEKAGKVWQNGLVGWMVHENSAWQLLHLQYTPGCIWCSCMQPPRACMQVPHSPHPPTHTLMYDYEEVFIVNSLPANFFASQSLCWKNLIQLKVRTIVYFLPFRALTTRGLKENDTNQQTGYHMCPPSDGVALAIVNTYSVMASFSSLEAIGYTAYWWATLHEEEGPWKRHKRPSRQLYACIRGSWSACYASRRQRCLVYSRTTVKQFPVLNLCTKQVLLIHIH